MSKVYITDIDFAVEDMDGDIMTIGQLSPKNGEWALYIHTPDCNVPLNAKTLASIIKTLRDLNNNKIATPVPAPD